MVHEVELNGEIHEFPDEATDEMIQKALNKDIGRQKFMNTINSGVLDRPRQRLSEDALSFGKNVLDTMGRGIPSTISEGLTSPLNTAKNIGVGLVGIPMNFANAMFNLPSYLAHLESNQLSNKMKQYTPQIPTEKIQNWMGGEPNQEEKNVRDLAGLAPILGPLGKAGVRGVGVAGKTVLGKSKDPLLAAKQLQIESKISGKEPQIEEAALKHQQNVEARQQAVAEAKKNLNMADADRMEYKLNAHKQKLEEMQKESAEAEKQLSEFPGAPEKPVSGNEHIERAQNALENMNKNEENIGKAEQLHESATKLAGESEKNLGDYLKSGASYDVRTARIVKPKLEEIKKAGSDIYDEVEKSVEGKGIVLSNTLDAKKITEDLFKLAQEGKIESPEALKLSDQLKSLNKKEIIPAKDYISALKAVNGYMRDAYKKAYEPGINEEKRNFYKSQAESAKQKFQEMNQILEQGIGKEDFARLKEAGDYWRTNVVPLYSEPLYWQILNKERLPMNMDTALRGGTAGSGLEIIRNLIKNDPEAVKHVIGQSYDKNPKNIHNPNELIGEYVGQDPHLQRLINIRNESHDTLKNYKQNIDLAKEKHAEAKAEHAEAKKYSSATEKEINQANKEYESQLKSHEKEKSDIEKKINNFQSEIKELKENIPKIEKHMKDVREKSNQENISLKQKMAHEAEFKKLKKELSDTKKKLFKSETGLKKLWTISKKVYYVGKKLF